MFANRFTAFLDACALAGALKRNLLLTLAEAQFYRPRWSGRVMAETQAAIARILISKGVVDAESRAERARSAMIRAFPEAMVSNYERFLNAASLPDANDAHVLAAALKTQASILVTDNLRDFPASALEPLNLEARSTDAFLANTIALDEGSAVAAIRHMRERFSRPDKTPEILLLDMEASGLVETADVLRPHIQSL